MSAAKNACSWLFVTLIVLAGFSLGRGQSASNTAATQTPLRQQADEATGASRCVVCHASEVEGYSRSAMAHSLRRAGREPDGSVTAHGSTITMHSSPTGYWQRWENGGDKTEYRIDYVIGSGTHASGYLVDIDDHLFQSPVAYYRSRQSYDLAPGYENQPDPDFTRPIAEGCVLCHSGTALHIAGTLNEYRSPVFPAEAITCERCHGPAEKHLADPRAGTIVNPAKLEPAARDSICEQCHLFGAARVPNPGKQFSDFIPGQPLEDAFTTYRDAVPAGSPAGAFKVISHVEQLALSACARNSGGRLWCGTCHDPHDTPAQPVQYFRSRCLSCHTTGFPTSHPSKQSDCLGCHMPRRAAKDGGHSAFTDHRIQRRPQTEPDLPPGAGLAAWREPTPDLQQRNLGIAYIDAGMQRHSSPFIIQGYRMLTEVQRQFTGDSEFFKWIGEALLLGKQPSEAKFAFERASQLDPDSSTIQESMASAYAQEGDNDGAITHLKQAVSLDPLSLPAVETLIELYQKQGRMVDATELSNQIKTSLSQTSDADQTSPAVSPNDSPKKAEELFHNIQVLKGVPSGELIPAMQFISSSLGVECSFCHVQDHFDKDDKKPKQTAREMMRMMAAINANSFGGRREVTCYSCHRGARNPAATPMVDADVQPNPGATPSQLQKLPGNLPTAGELIERYIQALGGASAIENVSSRIETGTANFNGQSVGAEIFTEVPEKRTFVRHLAGGDTITTYDGRIGWFSRAGRPTREMRGVNIEATQMEADLHFPLHIQQTFPELRLEYPEKIGDREAYVLVGVRENRLPAKLYFDEQSGLLMRLVLYAESPLGLDPEQIDSADYRDIAGVQVPFKITISKPGRSLTIQLEDVRQNVSIEDAKFAKPLSHSPGAQ
jgi:tetratricopeptide (TPR) repeat protein